MWRAIPIVLLVAAACAQPRVVEPSPPPSAAPSDTSAFPAGPVLFEPEQLIMPPEEFLLAEAPVMHDGPLAHPHAWERQFATLGSPDFRWFAVRLYVLEPDVRSTRFVEQNGCGTVTWAEEKPAPFQLAPPETGDGASACRYEFADGQRVLYLTTGFRNVGLLVGAQPRRDEMTDAMALQWLSAVARQQIAIIGRVLTKYPPTN